MKFASYLSGVILIVSYATSLNAVAKSRGSSPGDTLYRYETADGTTVMNSFIPPEFAQKGYDVLSSAGRLIKTVPPAPTKEEIIAQQIKAKQKEYDKLLLDNFPTVDDAIRSRDRQLESLQVRIDLNRGSILKLESDYRASQTEAALIERNGNEVPEDLSEDMAIFKRQANTLRASIDNLEAQKTEIMEKFKLMLSRLETLTAERDKKRKLILERQNERENKKKTSADNSINKLDTVLKQIE